jgi:ubiquinone/menaquinone biosynthesis C-methylase UbiE
MCKNGFVERVIPYKTQYALWQEHINRYAFASRFINRKVVLDVACGTGYGVCTLSRKADLVIGVDISKEALTYAKNHYGKRHNIEFVLSDAHSLPFHDDAYDNVVSFETLEHLFHYEEFLNEVKRVLRKTGTFIVSTPNKKIASPMEGQTLNPFHVKEFSVEEISRLLNMSFTSFQLYGQLYYTIKDWLFMSLNNLFPLSLFAREFGKIQNSIKALFKRSNTKIKTPDLQTSIFAVNPAYRVKKYRNIYPFYTPRFLVAVATK